MDFSLFTLTNFRHRMSVFPLSSLVIPIIVLLVLSLLVLPIPPMLLDVFFTFNIILALLIIMVAIHTATPKDRSLPFVFLVSPALS